MNKLLAVLVAGFFAVGAFAQAAPATPVAPAAAPTVKADSKPVAMAKEAGAKTKKVAHKVVKKTKKAMKPA